MTINLISLLNINDIYFFTADSAEMSADASAEKSAELPSPDDKPKEEEDTDGTKKMKKEFHFMFFGTICIFFLDLLVYRQLKEIQLIYQLMHQLTSQRNQL